MAKIATQTINGKAFEYALLNAFLERLGVLTSVSVVENSPYKTALNCFLSFDDGVQSHYKLVASFAVNFLMNNPNVKWGMINPIKYQAVLDFSGGPST